MLNSLCILIVVTNTLLKQAMTNLIVDQSDVTVVTRGINTIQELTDEIDRHSPDVVLLAEGTFLSSSKALETLLARYPALRAIVVSEASNWLHVFDKDEVQMTQAADLLDLIHSV
jgi:chemotaxis response regulator CheB